MSWYAAGRERSTLSRRIASLDVSGVLMPRTAVQQKSIDAAIKALKDGAAAPGDDVIEPLFARAAAAAKAEISGRAAANPFTAAANVDMFRKRFHMDLVADAKTKAVKVVKMA